MKVSFPRLNMSFIFRTLLFPFTLFLFGCCTVKVPNTNMIVNNVGAKWTLQAFYEESFPNQLVTLVLDTKSLKFQGKGPCNSYSGLFTLSKETIVFNSVMSTKMACDLLNQEYSYFKALEEVVTYNLVNNRLSLFDENQDLLLIFKMTL